MTGNDPRLNEPDLTTGAGAFEGAFIALRAASVRAPPTAKPVKEDE